MHPIPANATRIRFLRSDGSSYINTGVTLLDGYDARIRIVGGITETGTNTALIGARENDSGPITKLGTDTGSNFRFLIDSLFNAQTLLTSGDNFGTGLHTFDFSFNASTSVATLLCDVIRTTQTITSQTVFATCPLTIFGYNKGSSVSQNASTIIVSACQIWQGSTLVRDFVPVRVGQTGYLFDRVSGQFFGNAGMGDFVLGPDIQQGVVPSRLNPFGVRKKLTTWDYVQDGLYYQLDGIENAGRSVHSATATTWTDLTGNGRDATFLNAAAGLVWQDDAAYLYGKTHDGMAKISGLPSMTAFTFEIVHRRDAADSYARLYDTEAYFGGSRPKRLCALFGTSTYPSAMSFQIGSNNELNYSSISSSSGAARSFAITPTAYSSGYSARVCVDGAFVQTVNPPSVSSPQTTTYIDVGNRSNSPNRGFDGAVFAIRCYNRILTDEEITANYAIDKVRFNLP